MKGLIIGIDRGIFKVQADDLKVYQATLAGNFRKDAKLIFAGDRVEFNINGDEVKITKIFERKNSLHRPEVANVDKIFLITSLKKPDLNLYLLDKMLVVFEYNDIDVTLIFTKKDLLDKCELEEDLKIVDYYKSIGYECFVTDNITKQLIDNLEIKKDSINVFCGQSGVGKSSLLNLIDPSLNLKVSEISEALNRGRHTTRSINLYSIRGGLIADTPGFGNVELLGMDEASIATNTKEFFALSKDCRYKGCLHQNEPNCMVKQMVEAGKILKSRYDNYLLFLKEIKGEKR